MTTTIRRAAVSDAAALAALGRQTFIDAFGADNRPDDLELYLSHTYGEARQRAELLDRETITLVAEDDDALIAFAQLRRSAPPRCVDGPAPVELGRFYVERGWQGRGVAQQLMGETLAAARELGGETLWLSVWERNPRAIAFYAKCGFRDVGTQPFVVGNDVQTDRVMVCTLV